MSKVNIIRAWKDAAYRLSLSDEERALLPANPAGAIELEDTRLDNVSAGVQGSLGCTTHIECTYVCTGECSWVPCYRRL